MTSITPANRNRLRRGTSLIEVLVVIVVFLVGILAVLNIFPKGLQTLIVVRKNSEATALGRDEMERIKARPDLLPEQVLAVTSVNGFPITDTVRPPSDLGPVGDALTLDGILKLNANTVGPWQRFTGANGYRRIVGEGRVVPAPAQVGNLVGSLMVLQYGPRDVSTNETIYGNDLAKRNGIPEESVRRLDTEYFVDGEAGGTTLNLPTGSRPRQYRVAFSGYRTSGSGVAKTDFVGLVTPVIDPTEPDPATGNYPLYSVTLASLVTGTLSGVDYDSIRVSRVYRSIPTLDAFTLDEPYEYKILDSSVGVYLLNPAGAQTRIPQAGGASQPLKARIDYDVLDWRILRDEFRFDVSQDSQHQLPIGSIKVGGQAGPDGRPNSAIFLEDTSAIEAISNPKADNLIIIDLLTGGLVVEQSEATSFVTVDKSLGLLNISGPSAPDIRVLLPGGQGLATFAKAGRPLRVLFMAKDEWSVQLLKAASNYSLTTGVPGPGQYYVGGSNPSMGGSPTRLYFAPSEVANTVSTAGLDYQYTDSVTSANQVDTLSGQDFRIAYRAGADSIATPLPSIDIRDAVSSATAVNVNGARSVKGISVSVRAMYNMSSFSLNQNSTTNLRKLDQWGRNWKRAVVESFVQRGENVR